MEQLWSVLEKNLLTGNIIVLFEHLLNRDASNSCSRLRKNCKRPFEYSYYIKAEPKEE